ncbi:MAG TPA: DUF6786 family protein [Phycisphaerae bacterium]|nr:DUF6786 family protein [Phycisphaerae bacterium]
MAENNYAADAAFLSRHTEIVELSGEGGARVAVAPGYQGRVMTSTLAGGAGASFGWLNADFIASGQTDPKFNNYGGEDRFWLGPEAGQFGLWFAKGEPFDMGHWKTPAGFDRGEFRVTSKEAGSVAMATRFDVSSCAGTAFPCAVQRTVSLLGPARAAELLGAAAPDGVAMVAFESSNVLTNAGDAVWTREGGLLSVWILGQFKPLPRGKVIVPFRHGDDAELGPKATTDYFGPVPEPRCRIADDHLRFSCDGQFRSKIGISPARARPVLGSYDPDAKVLTVVQFNLPPSAAKLPYVNSLWEIQDAPFAGDAVNSYNDGEETPGAGQLGPFYEIETSSPAAELQSGGSITHVHRTFHFAGEFDALSALSVKVLGVGLAEIG